MGVELRPLGVKCNIQCQYCYQDPQRDAGHTAHRYDMDEMKRSLVNHGEAFTLFGGEPLLVKLPDLEELFAFGLKEFGKNSIQTNGSLITENHIALFKKYKVHVGVSIDGPGELNDVRWIGNLETTRKTTKLSENAIINLSKQGIPPSLIVTLHRNNATKDKLPIMHDWFHYLESHGVTSARLHVLEVDNDRVRQKYALSDQENFEALMSFKELESNLTGLKFDLFGEMKNMLLGKDRASTCVWNSCDPYTTRAVQGIEGNGQRSNCGRTNKDGIDFVKSDIAGYERTLALYMTPYEFGGCQGCRFFLMCKGQCPGTSIDGDWRNRSEHCQIWFDLYSELEKELEQEGAQPLSTSEDRKQVEREMVRIWSAGNNYAVQDIVDNPQYLEKLATGMARDTVDHIPHGDSHGDHTDQALARNPA